MKKFTLLSTMIASFTAANIASADGFQGNNTAYQAGGFNQSEQVSRVAEAKNGYDDQFVVLQGKIVKQVGGDEYLFRDASGEITLEIDHEDWHGVNVSPNDEIRVYGEIDKSWRTQVDVHRVEKVQ